MNEKFLLSIFILFIVKCGTSEKPNVLEDVWLKSMNALKDILNVKLEFLKKELSNFVNHTESGHNELEDPITIFLTIKRLTNDIRIIYESVIESYETMIEFQNFTSKWQFPSLNDLQKVSLSIARIQDTYNLNVSSLVKGQIANSIGGVPMTIDDCFEMGHQLSEAGKFHYAEIWLKEAFNMLDATDEFNENLLRSDILLSLIHVYEEQKNFAAALKYLELLKDQDSRSESNALHQNYLKKKILQKRIAKHKNRRTKSIDEKEISLEEKQKKLCQNQLERLPAAVAPLRCRYVINNSFFLKIAPLKLEELSLDPYLVVYYDVMYDNEIEIIKNLAIPNLDVSTTTNSGESINENRTSKTSWLDDSEHSVVRDISTRVADMTGLSTVYSEPLQVVNYGIGGHYDTHYDFFIPMQPDRMPRNGNRIATILFYMNDVQMGGFTVFPLIDIAVPPKKGSALLWYNLYKSGRQHFLTQHAGCPVIMGNKWVCNKWLHEFGQEMKRPCALKRDDSYNYRHLYFD